MNGICPICGGQGALLGTLGNTTWLRCIQCGWEFTGAPESEESEEDDGSESE